MAAIGGFGRTRRNGGDLTSLIASLLREQQAQRDQNIFDAWQNGGEFEGKPVTDKRIIDYIKGRRNEYTKDDPLWDQWNDTLVQTRFSIGEQEITLKFNQGKVGAGAVAAYYKNQLNKIPRHSQFYRTVAGRAAQWAKSAAGAARGAARSRASAALSASITRASRGAALYDAFTAQITEAARQAGLIHGSTATFFDAPATTNGRQLSLQDFVDALGAHGATFNGHKVTFAYWQHLSQRKVNSLNQQIALKKQAGYSTKTLRSQRASFLTKDVAELNTFDDREQYERLHEQFQDDWNSANNNPDERIKAATDYANALLKLADRASQGGPREQAYVDFIGALRNEAGAIQTGEIRGPSAWDIFSNDKIGTSYGHDDITGTIETLYGDGKGNVGDYAKSEGLKNGTMYYGQQNYGDTLDVIPGSLDDLSIKQTVAYQDIDGELTPVVLAGKPMEAVVYKKPDGTIATPDEISALGDKGLQAAIYRGDLIPDKEHAQTVGFVYDNPATPGRADLFAAFDAQGTLHFTTENPFTGTVDLDGNFIGTANANGRVDPNSVINQDVIPNAPTLAVEPGTNPLDIINLGKKLLAQGDTQGQALIELGTSQQQKLNGQEAFAKSQMAAVQTPDLNAGLPAAQRAGGYDYQPLTRQGQLQAGGFGNLAPPPPGINPIDLPPPIKPQPPASPSTAIKPLPQINIPAPPPVVTITPDNGMGSAIGFKTGSKPKQKAPKPEPIKYQNNGNPSQSKGFY